MEKTPAEELRGGGLDPRQPTAVSEDDVQAQIDRDSDASFPASDPPGWTLGIEAGYGQAEPGEAAAAPQ